MTGDTAALTAHLKSGLTTVCRAWAITRKDGTVFGFTDHDCALSFGGITFRADTGLTALALQQSTGLSVDNTEALGALSDAAISEDDIEAGRFDGADVRSWLVNWADTAQHKLLFRGTIGEIHRADGGFRAEVRGLSDALNQPLGRVFQKPCTAVLGDASCAFDTTAHGFTHTGPALEIPDAGTFTFPLLSAFDAGWFQRGRLEVLSGKAAGLAGAIKQDRTLSGQRVIELWEPVRAAVAPGDNLRLIAGCDKRFETCRLKFGNAANFQGFPDLPEDDWMLVHPSQATALTSGSRRG